jgi:hypothetical protein
MFTVITYIVTLHNGVDFLTPFAIKILDHFIKNRGSPYYQRLFLTSCTKKNLDNLDHDSNSTYGHTVQSPGIGTR